MDNSPDFRNGHPGLLRKACMLVSGLAVLTGVRSADNGIVCAFAPLSPPRNRRSLLLLPASWKSIESQLEPAWSAEPPVSIDSVLDPSTPSFSKDRPTLFRERHGWCPYSERVWLALEAGNVAYDTVRIDNTGGPRPSYFGGQTPQMKWPGESRNQGESMDLVYKIDELYCDGKFQGKNSRVQSIVSEFRNIFPRARPSSRAAFLFQYNGEPLWKSTFETTLKDTDTLLADSEGPFFYGKDLTAADIAWAPFLERYRYQLPCLHAGLLPEDPEKYPQLASWYKAMDTRVPAYACRVKGDASSWRKVLTMAGFGNAGLPPAVSQTMKDRVLVEEKEACASAETAQTLWNDYASTRPYVAPSPAFQAALTITRNRDAIIKDTVKRGGPGLPSPAFQAALTITRKREHLHCF